MKRLHLPPFALLALVLMGTALIASSAWAAPDEDPMEQLRADYGAAENEEAQYKLLVAFVTDHPDHPYAMGVLGAATDLLANPLGDREGAIKLAKSHLEGADAEKGEQVQDILFGLYSAPETKAQLAAMVAERFDPATMSFGDHKKVLEAAAAAEDWAMVNEFVGAAEPTANAEAFRADFPDADYDDAMIEASGSNRRGMLQTFAGWAAANQGSTDAALKVFAQAETLVRRSFAGQPENQLNRWWGLTLVKDGQKEAGLEMLALAGLYGGDFEAEEKAREVYDDLGRAPDAYDDFLWSMRLKHAPQVGDFTGTDYEGVAHRYADLRGEKATLLAFWFPT